jgi:hypothetical protein
MEFLDTLPPFEEELFVGEFRRTLQESHHICYEFKDWSWHASALWLATGYDQRKWMLTMRSESCAMCRVTSELEDFVTVGKRIPAAVKPQERLDALLQEIVSQSKDLFSTVLPLFQQRQGWPTDKVSNLNFPWLPQRHIHHWHCL